MEKTDPNPQKVNGGGLSAAELEISAYQKKRIELIAAPNSSLKLYYSSPAPLNMGFMFQWSADATKGPADNAKLAIKIR